MIINSDICKYADKGIGKVLEMLFNKCNIKKDKQSAFLIIKHINRHINKFVMDSCMFGHENRECFTKVMDEFVFVHMNTTIKDYFDKAKDELMKKTNNALPSTPVTSLFADN